MNHQDRGKGRKAREKRMRGLLCQGNPASTGRPRSADSRARQGTGMAKQRSRRKPARTPRPMRMTTAQAAVSSLVAHGIDTVYALPGVHNDHLFDAFAKAANRVRVVHARHEQGAAYMALGAALAT